MAHYVAKVLHQRPNDILDKWSVAELLVAYGQFSNEETYRNFQEWKRLGQKEKKAYGEKPEEFHVLFYAPDDLKEEGGQ